MLAVHLMIARHRRHHERLVPAWRHNIAGTVSCWDMGDFLGSITTTDLHFFEPRDEEIPCRLNARFHRKQGFPVLRTHGKRHEHHAGNTEGLRDYRRPRPASERLDPFGRNALFSSRSCFRQRNPRSCERPFPDLGEAPQLFDDADGVFAARHSFAAATGAQGIEECQ